MSELLMILSPTRSRIKERCAIGDSSYDTLIDNLIADLQPAIEFSIEPAQLASSDAGLQATLNLGLLELLCGEFCAIRLLEAGAADAITIGDLEIRPPVRDLSDPSGLKTQGMRRLAPFLKPDPSSRLAAGVIS